MKSKFRKKSDLSASVKDIWAKSWTVKTTQLKQLGKKNQNSNPDTNYYQISSDMFSVKKLTISK